MGLIIDHVTKVYRPVLEVPVVAIDDVHVRFEQGSSTAIIGPNGAGKSTLLKLIAGVTAPDSGSISRPRKTLALIDLAAGFEPNLTGAENAEIGLFLAGVSRSQQAARWESIRDMAGIGRAFDDPVRSYSSGMVARLGFSVAVHSSPELLLIDEVLAVGDAAFQRLAVSKVRELVAEGTTLVFVTHDLVLARSVVEHAVWLDSGIVRAVGSVGEVAAAYEHGLLGRARLVGDRVRIVDAQLRPSTIAPGGAIVVTVLLRAEVESEIVLEAHLRVPIGNEEWMRAGDEGPLLLEKYRVAVTQPSEPMTIAPGLSTFAIEVPSVSVTPCQLDLVVGVLAPEGAGLYDDAVLSLVINGHPSTPRLFCQLDVLASSHSSRD